MAEKAATLKKEWNACLSQSGGAPGRCEKIQKEFDAASKSAGIESCISETTNLMRCTMGSGKKNGCGEEFMMMRECNRASGRQLLAEGSGFSVAPGASNLFLATASSLTMSKAPERSLDGMTEAGKDFASSLGISAPAF